VTIAFDHCSASHWKSIRITPISLVTIEIVEHWTNRCVIQVRTELQREVKKIEILAKITFTLHFGDHYKLTKAFHLTNECPRTNFP
jgi:hypothetical protein